KKKASVIPRRSATSTAETLSACLDAAASAATLSASRVGSGTATELLYILQRVNKIMAAIKAMIPIAKTAKETVISRRSGASVSLGSKVSRPWAELASNGRSGPVCCWASASGGVLKCEAKSGLGSETFVPVASLSPETSNGPEITGPLLARRARRSRLPCPFTSASAVVSPSAGSGENALPLVWLELLGPLHLKTRSLTVFAASDWLGRHRW